GALKPVRCAKLEAPSTIKIDKKARASATWSAEARTQLSCFFFMFFLGKTRSFEESSLYSPETGERSSRKKWPAVTPYGSDVHRCLIPEALEISASVLPQRRTGRLRCSVAFETDGRRGVLIAPRRSACR